MYINIGMGTDAKKFILQSVGRGARIEPLPGYHKRFNFLKAGEKLSEEESLIFNQVKKDILPLESEFIFGTNRDALQTVIEELEQEDRHAGSREISLRKNEERVSTKLLLIPVFKQQDKLLLSSA
jgi:type III restriction enzyme